MRRLLRATVTPRQYYLATCAALGALTLIVFTGAAVRVTGSGLGCPDWPRCYHDGRLTPELNTHAYIEFGNRMLTTIVSLAAVGAVLLAYRRRPFRRDLAWLAWLLPAGVVGQAVMGGLTVKYGLAPSWVIAHLVLSMLVLVAAGTLVWRARPATDLGPEPRRATVGLARALWIQFALGGLTIFVGTIATAAGPHAGGEGTGDVVSRLEFRGPGTLRWLVERHGTVAGLLGLLSVAVFVAARRTGADAHLVTRQMRVCLLLALQGALGIAQYALALPAELVWIHVSLAALLWVGIVLAAVQAGAPWPAGSARRAAAVRPAAGERRAPV